MIRELTWGIDYFVRYIDFKTYKVGGASTLNDDGTYNIYINSRLSVKKQWEAFIHELVHCEAGHLDEYKDLPLAVKEYEADHLVPILRAVWESA